MSLSARADIFIFHDLTDVITVERIGSGPTVSSLLGHFLPDIRFESADLTLSRDDGTRIVSPANVYSGLNFGIEIVGPNEPPDFPSDALLWTGLTGGGVNRRAQAWSSDALLVSASFLTQNRFLVAVWTSNFCRWVG